MQGVLTLAIELWTFGSPGGLPSPHFGSVSLIFTLFQSRVATAITKTKSSWENNLMVGRSSPRITLKSQSNAYHIIFSQSFYVGDLMVAKSFSRDGCDMDHMATFRLSSKMELKRNPLLQCRCGSRQNIWFCTILRSSINCVMVG
jgi:hypothetical protein